MYDHFHDTPFRVPSGENKCQSAYLALLNHTLAPSATLTLHVFPLPWLMVRTAPSCRTYCPHRNTPSCPHRSLLPHLLPAPQHSPLPAPFLAAPHRNTPSCPHRSLLPHLTATLPLARTATPRTPQQSLFSAPLPLAAPLACTATLPLVRAAPSYPLHPARTATVSATLTLPLARTATPLATSLPLSSSCTLKPPPASKYSFTLYLTLAAVLLYCISVEHCSVCMLVYVGLCLYWYIQKILLLYLLPS